MKKNWAMGLVLLAGLIYVGYALAQTNGHYVCSGPVSINSTTVPVGVVPPARMTTWEIQNWDATNAVLCFPYVGATVPTAVPSPSPEHRIAAGSLFTDQVQCDVPTCQDAIGQGWACVEQSAGPVNVDGCYR